MAVVLCCLLQCQYGYVLVSEWIAEMLRLRVCDAVFEICSVGTMASVVPAHAIGMCKERVVRFKLEDYRRERRGRRGAVVDARTACMSRWQQSAQANVVSEELKKVSAPAHCLDVLRQQHQAFL